MITKHIGAWILSTTLVLAPSIVLASFENIPDKASVQILTPSFAHRQISKIKLKNGLEALLISDPLLKQSGAALAVEAGSWDDPKEYPGMAHFLEHMLFMGTKAYPDEAEYMQYIREYGGNVNAFTAPDRTVYMFSIDHVGFKGALDRFSHFFIDPLFSRSSISRELHAVDQEHAKNVENDGSRIYMVFKETGNPNHPNIQFSTGNAKTLSGIPQEAMIDWYKKFYSASKMHLVMMSNLGIAEMQKIADEDFSKIEVSSYTPKPINASMFSEKQKGAYIYVKPVKDIKALSLNWEIPKSFLSDYQTQIPRLLCYVINSEAENTLSQYLKKERLAEGLRASFDRYGKNEGLLCVDITLTDKGLQEKEKVIQAFYELINKLKESGIPSSTFEEMKQLCSLNYEYQSRDDVFETLTTFANDMVDEPLETFPTSGLIPTEYNEAKIQSFLKTLTPSSGLTFVIADPEITGIEPDRKEKWVQAEYCIRAIPSTVLNAWSNAAPNPDIGLPPPNPFIPQDFNLLSASTTLPTALKPTLIANNSLCTLYHLTDNQYQVPETSLIFGFKTPFIDGSAKSCVLNELFIRAFCEKLAPTIEAASTASLQTTLRVKDVKLQLNIAGFSDKALELAKTLFSNLKKVEISKDLFDQYKQYLASELENASKELPFKQALEMLNSVIVNDSPLSSEKLEALNQLNYEDFASYAKSFLEDCYIEGLIYGNTSIEASRELYSYLQTTFGNKDDKAEKDNEKAVLILPKDVGPFCIKESTKMLGNSALLCVEQGKLSLQTRSAQQILSYALKEAFFDTLRTKQQTGYIAKAFDVEIGKELFMLFGVQSVTHTPDELLSRYELFLEDFVKNYTERLSIERFENIKNSLISDLSQPLENLPMMAERLFTLAFYYKGDFDWIQKRIAATKAINYEEVKTFAINTLSRKNRRRIGVLINGVQPSENTFIYETLTPKELIEEGTYTPAE